MSFNVGEMVGPYRVIEQLGQGGMATVYKAYHAALDRYVAIKVLHPALLEDASFLARFQREARLVAKLDHPNIVPIFDYAEHDGRPYLVMKFIEGETLKSRLSRGPLESKLIAAITDAIGAALGYAHTQGILHRDIKPSNVLLTSDGQIYLADFGLARIAQSGESSLTSDIVLGTPQYMSPEQALGKKDLDAGTDIYSFGVMLYEMIVGKVPFSADTPFSVIHDHIYSALPMPRQVNPNVSEAMERVLLKSLAKERFDRYKDVQSLVEAFQLAWEETSKASLEKTIVPEPNETAVRAAKPSPTKPTASRQLSNSIQENAEEDSVMATLKDEKTGNTAAISKKRIGCLLGTVLAALALGLLLTIPGLRSFRQQTGTLAPSMVPEVKTLMPFRTPGTFWELGLAEKYVIQHPDDPRAALRLALAYQAANLPSLALNTINDFERLSKGHEILFWDAGLQFGKRGAWLQSARLYVDASELHLRNGPLPLVGRDKLDEAVYKAFREKDAPGIVSFDRLTAIDTSLEAIANIRYIYYSGDKVRAQNLLDQLNQTKPGKPLAQLIQAEFYAETNVEMARKALLDVRANPGSTAWILAEANSIERTIH